MPRPPDWTEAEIAILQEHKNLRPQDIHDAYLPNRTRAAIANMRDRLRDNTPVPAVKEPGEYLETLADLLVDDFECLEIWLRWNGYASARVLSVDGHGWCTLLCTAKGALCHRRSRNGSRSSRCHSPVPAIPRHASKEAPGRPGKTANDPSCP